MKNGEKHRGFFIFIILLSAIGGKFIGDIAGNSIKGLSFLKTSFAIGTTTPINLDLKVLAITFGINFNLNIMSIIGVILAIILYKRR